MKFIKHAILLSIALFVVILYLNSTSLINRQDTSPQSTQWGLVDGRLTTVTQPTYPRGAGSFGQFPTRAEAIRHFVTG